MITPTFLYMISSGSCQTLSRVSGAERGGLPRLYTPGDIYVYRCSGALLTSRDGGITWIDILPAGFGVVNVIAQTVGEISESVENTTYVIGYGSGGYLARYQKVPEALSWSSGSTPPVGLVPEDAASDLAGEIGILVGNIASTSSRIVGAFTGAPFNLEDSDAGIPQISPDIALITDIEICE